MPCGPNLSHGARTMAKVTVNGVAVPYEQDDENTLAIVIGGIPPGTPIRVRKP